MDKTKQRGSAWSIKLAIWFYNIFGYMPFFILLYPITFIYYLKARNVRKALKLYYKQIKVPFSEYTYFEHLRRFAIVMTDRFISKIDSNIFVLEYDKEKLHKEIKNGAILLFSHYGGWPIIFEYSKEANKPINIIMKEVMKEEIKNIEDNLSNKSKDKFNNLHTIDLSKNSPLEISIQIASAISKKEIVAMMGDRISNAKRVVNIPFFEKNAKFNKTPFELAKNTNLPLIVYFIIYKKPKVYYLEYEVIKPCQKIEQMVEQYVKIYEKIIKIEPRQWFNLYDFWGN